MKQFFILVLLTFIVHRACQAQTTDTGVIIAGTVRCRGNYLAFISVFIKETGIGTVTDQSGYFQLNNLSPGVITLVARGVGYKSTEIKVIARANTKTEIEFILEEDVLNLEEVVVTANRQEISRAEAPVIVSTLTPEFLESAQAVNIAGGLDFVPGLRMEYNCQNCGLSQVRMNGLGGPYSQILIDSRPVFSGLAGIYGLELIPASMVERIEVVRGGGSVLFGGNAIAGTVNIITKEPDLNSFSVEGRYGLTGLGNSYKNNPAGDRLLNINGSAVTKDFRSGLCFFGMIRDRGAFDENGDKYTEMVGMNNTTIGLNTFHKISDHSKIVFNLYRINEFRRGGNKLDHLPHEADIAEQINHRITGANVNFNHSGGRGGRNKLILYCAGQKVDRDSYFGAKQDPAGYGFTRDLASSVGGQYFLQLGRKSTFSAGLDDNFNKLKDTKLGFNGLPNRDIIDQFSNTIGIYGQYEWHTGIFKTAVGIRYDSYLIRDLDNATPDSSTRDIKGSVLVPRISLLADISPDLQFRSTYGKGYRAPQIFDEDLHIEASGARRIVHKNTVKLIQESSHSFTASLRYVKRSGSVMTEILTEGFYTRLRDPFAYTYEFIDSTSTLVKIRSNAQHNAHVTGANLELNSAFGKNVTLQTGFTLQASRYNTAQMWGEGYESTTTFFLRSPRSYGFLSLDWQPAKKISVSFTASYTGRMYVAHFGLDPVTDEELVVVHEGRTDDLDEERLAEIYAILNHEVIEGERLEHTEQFMIFGIRLAYDLPVSKEAKLQVYAGVQNLLNQIQQFHDSGVYRDAGYIYGPNQPRTINFGLKFENLW